MPGVTRCLILPGTVPVLRFEGFVNEAVFDLNCSGKALVLADCLDEGPHLGK